MISFPTHVTQRVFIVDDEPSLRDLFSVALEEPAREVVTCENGFAALRMLAENTFDLILLDLSLPDISGIHILREMRKRGDETRVILCSANVDQKSFQTAVELGAVGFLSKPVTLSTLRETVSQVLSGSFDENRSAAEFAQQHGFSLGSGSSENKLRAKNS